MARRPTLWAISIFGGAVSLAGQSLGCEMPLLWNTQMLYEEAAVIVDAVVTKVELVENALPSDISSDRSGVRVTFETVEAIKGEPRKIDTVWANSTSEKGCMFQALAGQQYLLVIMVPDEIRYKPRKGQTPFGHVSVLGSQFLIRGFDGVKEFNERIVAPVRALVKS